MNNLKVTKLVNENNSSCVFCDQVPLKMADGEETCSVFLQAVQHLIINWETCHLSFSEYWASCTNQFVKKHILLHRLEIYIKGKIFFSESWYANI